MRIIYCVAALLLSNAGQAQLLKNIKDAVKNKAEQKTAQKASDKTGNVMDEALDGKLFKKKAKKEENGKEEVKAEKAPTASDRAPANRSPADPVGRVCCVLPGSDEGRR